jgi:LPS sulfotransferase NodH
MSGADGMKANAKEALTSRDSAESDAGAAGRVHLSRALYMPEYDFQPREEAPSAEVMIAATPRSGSTAFCLSLWRTGLLGAPLEYANFGVQDRIGRWARKSGEAWRYWDEIKRARTGPNGVFSYKFFIPNYLDLRRTAPELLPRISPSHVIYFTREDTLAQAISYSKAAKSGIWFGGATGTTPAVEFDPQHIRDCYFSILRQRQSWEQVFELTNATVLRVSYEEFLRDRRATAQRVARFVLGENATTAAIDIPDILIQRDEESVAWKERLKGVEDAWRAEQDVNTERRRREVRRSRSRQENMVRRPPGGSGLSWSPERQVIFHNRRVYAHDGSTDTEPSHDLAHVLIGMGSSLLWCPRGSDDEVRISEFNAVFLEHLLSTAYECVMCRSISLQEILPKALRHARWFVQEHYAPFPMATEEAYRQFCTGIDPATLADLSPYFFMQKDRERVGNHRRRVWEMRLKRRPPVELSERGHQFQAAVLAVLNSITARQVRLDVLAQIPA